MGFAWITGSALALQLITSPAGTVVDPQGRPIPQARVILVCGDRSTETYTDGQGRFAFPGADGDPRCTIVVSRAGFEPAQVTHPTPATRVQLVLAPVRETVNVRGEAVPGFAELSGGLFTADSLRAAGATSDALIAYARTRAGALADADAVYVDGLPAARPPPAAALARIGVDQDAFGAEWADAGRTRIELETVVPDRAWRWSTSGLAPFNLGHPRDAASTSSTSGPEVAVSGGVPHVPLTFQADVQLERTRRSAPFPPAAGLAALPVPVVLPARVEDGDSRRQIFVSSHYVTPAARVSVSWSDATWTSTNVGATETTLESARLSAGGQTRTLQSTMTRTHPGLSEHHSFSVSNAGTWTTAHDDSLGIDVLDVLTSGGAPALATSSHTLTVASKDVIASTHSPHAWDAGMSMTYTRASDHVEPNPHGRLVFGRLQDYVDAIAGLPAGRWFLDQGPRDARASTFAAAVFSDRTLATGRRGSLRASVRLDYERADGVSASPRMSGVVRAGAWTIRGGAGLFVTSWDTGTRALASWPNSGTYHALLASPAGLDVAGALGTAVPIRGAIAPDFTRTRVAMTRVGLQRSAAHWSAGIEHTWLDQWHAAGSQRLPDGSGFVDLLDSNRRSVRQYVQAVARVAGGRVAVAGRYAMTDAHDDTDGAFSFPAQQGDPAADWAPSARVPPRVASITVDVQAGGGVGVTFLGSWRASARYDVRSGLDLENNGLFSDRGDWLRNGAWGPSYRSLDLMARKRLSLDHVWPFSGHTVAFDVGLRISNVLDTRNDTRYGAVLASPLFGQPLGHLPGRSVALSVTVGK